VLFRSDFLELPDLLALLLPGENGLAEAVKTIAIYLLLQEGSFAIENSYLVPGLVTAVNGETGLISFRFDDRRAEFGPDEVASLRPKPANDFAGMLLYQTDELRDLANEDPVALVKTALRSNRDSRIMYKELKSHIVELMTEKGWKSWWAKAKPVLKRDEMIGMSAGSQPSFRLLRQADKYEDRLRREFDFSKTPLKKLMRVMSYLDEVTRGSKPGKDGHRDDELLAHFGNGAAKVAVAVLKEDPGLALAGLALHAEVAATGVAVARPNPKACAQVVKRIDDFGELTRNLPESLLQRVLNYVRTSMPEGWGIV